mmetsp:Transcript_27328/g.88239  ORF Transcript_27328/g.88239 Transcript_27328/m.88239 type:complete len:218 (-) Transcript_27328:2126-2779(-)
MVVREGRDLLQTPQRHVIDASRLTLRKEIVVHLAGAQHQLADLFVWLESLSRVWQVAVESGARQEVLEVALHQSVAEKRFWRHDDEGLAKLAHHLPTEHVEIVCGCGDVDNSPVGALCLTLPPDDFRELVLVVVAHLQEALQPRRGVLRALAFIPVGEEHHQTALPKPLLLSGRQELVDHALRRVCKVSELGFPHDEGGRVLERIAHLKAEHSKLGE